MKRAPFSRLLTVAAVIAATTWFAGSSLAGPRLAQGFGDHFDWWASSGRGRLGIEIMSITPELRRYFSAPEDRGVLVARVRKGSRADRAGVKVGDVIVRADKEAIRRAHDLVLLRGRASTLEVVRKGSTLTLKLPKAKADDEKGPDRWGPFRHFRRHGGPWRSGPRSWRKGPRPWRWFQHGNPMRKELDKMRKRLEKLEKRLGDKSGLSKAT